MIDFLNRYGIMRRSTLKISQEGDGMRQERYSAEVVKRKDITSDLFCLWLKVEQRKKFTFKPGQYCTIGLEGIWRPYSIVSAPEEETIELFVELVPPPEGNLTPLLHTLKVGDAVSLLPKAKGIFTFDPKFVHHVMVATVTGIAPFISMIRDQIYREVSSELHDAVNGGYDLYVLHGASYSDEFGYKEELEDIAEILISGIDVLYIPTVSRPDEERNSSWTGQRGRVNLILPNYVARWGLNPKDTIVYACGHPGMVQDVKEKLGPQEWKVKEERYWK